MSEQINGHTFHYDVADDVVTKRYAEHLRNSQAQAQSDSQQFTGHATSGYVAPVGPCPTCHRCPTCGHYGSPYQQFYPSSPSWASPVWTCEAPPADKFNVFNGLQGGLENWQPPWQQTAGNKDDSKLSGCS